jgi:hypothetical protein
MHSFSAGGETEHGVRRSRWRSWSNLRPWIRQGSTAGKTAGRWSQVAHRLSIHIYLYLNSSVSRIATQLLRTLSNRSVYSVCVLCVCVCVCSVCVLCVFCVCVCVCSVCVLCTLCVSVCVLCVFCVCVLCVFCVCAQQGCVPIST